MLVRMARNRVAFTLFASVLLVPFGRSQSSLVSVEIPVNSCNAGCHPLNDNVWRIAAPPFPLDVTLGIGNLVADENQSEIQSNIFTLHDALTYGNHVPDPRRAVVTYEFDQPTVIDQVEIIQHANGITRIEGFVGGSLGSLVSVGSIFGPDGDVTGTALFTEGEQTVFDFDNLIAGTFFQFIIRKTSFGTGFASYRAYPRDQAGNRVPPSSDCNGNGVADTTDLAMGTSLDANGNGIPDECDFFGVGLWRFEEGTPNQPATAPGSVLDSSPWGDHGTPTGDPVYKNDVSCGSPSPLALWFDGVDSEVLFANTFVFHTPSEATVEFWMKSEPVPSGTGTLLLSGTGVDTNRFHVWQGNGIIGLDYKSASGAHHVLFGGVPAPDQEWVHVAFTRTVEATGDHTYSAYVDGVLTGSVVDTPQLPTAAGWRLGIGTHWKGLLNDVRFTDRALVPAEFLNWPWAACPTYCTAGVSASGCTAALSAAGVPSATAPSGFTVTAANVEGAKDGMFFYGVNGRQAVPWGTGYQCVVPPVMRGGLMPGVGTANACDGMFTQDLNARWCPTCPRPLHNPGVGAVMQAQFWYRDPWNTGSGFKTTTLSDAIEFTVGP
jgi:hypothetical protein